MARKAKREAVTIDASYELNGIEASCEIIDISVTGLRMRVKGGVYAEDRLLVKIGRQILPSVVVDVEGNLAGLKFEALSNSQESFLQNLNLRNS